METTLSWIVVLFIFKNTLCQEFGKTYADFQQLIEIEHSRLLQKKRLLKYSK